MTYQEIESFLGKEVTKNNKKTWASRLRNIDIRQGWLGLPPHEKIKKKGEKTKPNKFKDNNKSKEKTNDIEDEILETFENGLLLNVRVVNLT